MKVTQLEILHFVKLCKYSTIHNGYENDLDKYRKHFKKELFLELMLNAYYQYTNLSYVILGLLYCLRNFKKITILDLLLIPMLNSQHQDPEIREQCLKCFEEWNDKPALFFLYQFTPDALDWLNEYRIEIIHTIDNNL